MSVTQVTLSEAEKRALEDLSQSQNKTPEEILHLAIEQFLERHETQNRHENRLATLGRARGMWRDRQDLPDTDELRRQWDRF